MNIHSKNRPWTLVEAVAMPTGVASFVKGSCQNNFPKNTPKSACQAPSDPDNYQNPHQRWRFLSKILGIVPPPNSLQLK